MLVLTVETGVEMKCEVGLGLTGLARARVRVRVAANEQWQIRTVVLRVTVACKLTLKRPIGFRVTGRCEPIAHSILQMCELPTKHTLTTVTSTQPSLSAGPQAHSLTLFNFSRSP